MTTIANVEQHRAWNGIDACHWTDEEARYNRAVAVHYRRMLEAIPLAPSDVILDVGCGCGESTRDAARVAVAGSALGVDLSDAMIQRARTRAEEEGLTNARFEVADAQIHDFSVGAFDHVMSRYGSMFFDDPLTAFRNLARALKQDGQLTLLVWMELGENEWTREIFGALADGAPAQAPPPPGSPTPFGLGNAQWTRAMLREAGFADIEFAESRGPMWFGTDAVDAFRFFATSGLVVSRLQDADDATTQRVHRALRNALASHETAAGVVMGSASWIITARKA
jgi:SAM-dependent methyltransferase